MPAPLSAAQRRALAEQDVKWLALPLARGSDPAPVAAHIRHMVKFLGAGRRPSPAAAAAHWGQLYDRTVPQNLKLACRQGCAHCCKQSVSVYAPEAFRIAQQLRDRPVTIDAMRVGAAKLAGLKPDANQVRWMSCPLLAGNLCTAYEARPLNCRAFAAFDVRECIAAFVMMGKPVVHTPVDFTNMRTYCHMLMVAALRLAGRSDAMYEMNAAVSRILETPDAERRWLSGDDILADLAQDMPVVPAIEAEIQRLVAFIAPTVSPV
jgi:Fe-S-cluster containining protein